MDRVRVGVIGCGGVAQVMHLPYLRELDDRFQIQEVVSRSGMASIFKAKDMTTGEIVAIKIPHMQFESDVAFFSRFQREAESLARVEVTRSNRGRSRTRARRCAR